MSIEQQMGQFEDKKTITANQMQMQLADMHGEDIISFIENRAEGFRGIIAAHPELLEDYLVSPEETLKKIEPFLYH